MFYQNVPLSTPMVVIHNTDLVGCCAVGFHGSQLVLGIVGIGVGGAVFRVGGNISQNIIGVAVGDVRGQIVNLKRIAALVSSQERLKHKCIRLILRMEAILHQFSKSVPSLAEKIA